MADFFSGDPTQLDMDAPDMNEQEWDGILMFELDNLDDLKRFFSEKEYAAILRPDETTFINIKQSRILVGQPPEWNSDLDATYA